MTHLAMSVVMVLHVIANEGPITPKDICESVSLAPRTVSQALNTLMKRDLCKKVPNLMDMRQPFYIAKLEIAKPLLKKYEMDSVIRTPPPGFGYR